MTDYRSITGVALVATMAFLSSGCAGNETPRESPSLEETTAVIFAEGIPGGIIVHTMTLDAEVVAINHKARTAELLLPNGEELPITAGPEAINFDLINKGDRVKALASAELAIYLGDENAADSDGSASISMRADKGEQPGGMVTQIDRFTATVTAIDVERHTATLKFEDGRSETVNVRPDVDLTKQSVGAKVVFEITRLIALSVEKLP